MDNDQLSYDKVVERIKTVAPILDNPEELTQTVMAKIEIVSSSNRKSRLMLIMGITSGIAASLMLCLLIYQMNRSISFPPLEAYNAAKFSKPEAPGFLEVKEMLPVKNSNDYSFSEKIETFSSIIKEKQERKIKVKRMYIALSGQFKNVEK